MEGVLLEARQSVLFSSQKPFSLFFLRRIPILFESGCNLVISRRVGWERMCDPVLTTYKGKAAGGAPGKKCSPDRTEVPGDLPSLLPARTVGTRC